MVSLRRQSVHTPRTSPTAQRARSADAQQSRYTDEVPIELYREARNEAVTRFHEQQQQQQRQEQERRRKVEEDNRDEPDSDDFDSTTSPSQTKKAPTLLERIRMEKNRVVQRCLVACRLAEPSRDVFFKQKKKEFADAIELLQDTKRNIQKLTAQVQKFTSSVTSFAGDSTSYTQIGLRHMPRQTFLQSAQQIESRAAAFSDEVQQQIVKTIDARIATLEKLHALIVERCDLQVDVDYAKRKLAVAQQKGDVNQISERKYSLALAQKHCAAVTKTLVAQLALVSPDQQPEIQALLTQFSHLLLEFFQFGDELLAPAAPAHAPADGADAARAQAPAREPALPLTPTTTADS